MSYVTRAISFISKVPQLIRVGQQVVELNENQYIGKLQDFLGKKFRKSKVPGPWKDEPRRTDFHDSQNPKLAKDYQNKLDELYPYKILYLTTYSADTTNLSRKERFDIDFIFTAYPASREVTHKSCKMLARILHGYQRNQTL